MNPRSHLFLMLSGCILWMGVLAGCNHDPDTLAPLLPVVTRTSQAAEPASADASELAIEDMQFTASYPNRIDPFSFPTQSADPRTGSSGPLVGVAIDVLGFADVEEPRVFLRIDGNTHSMAVGHRIRGVEVIKIKPPVVELRRGSLVWNATMFGGDRKGE